MNAIRFTAKRILERHRIKTSPSFVKIPEFKANFLFIGVYLYGLVFYLKTIGVR